MWNTDEILEINESVEPLTATIEITTEWHISQAKLRAEALKSELIRELYNAKNYVAADAVLAIQI